VTQQQLEADKNHFPSGTTAAVVLMRTSESQLVLAHVGDSQVVLCHRGRARLLTPLHTPNNENERVRCQSEGATVEVDPWGRARLNGVLEVTRALGSSVWNYKGISSLPEVITYNLTGEEDCFFIIGSDGIFNKMTCQEAVDIVKFCETPQEAADVLTNRATTHLTDSSDSSDNTTAVVVRLKGWGNYKINYSEELRKRNLNTIFGYSLELSDDLANLIEQNATRDDMLKHLFDMFDVSKSGKLSLPNIKDGMWRLGCYLDKDVMDLILLTADENSDKLLDFAEFLKINAV